MKLFYILTGRETEEDFAELAGFVKWLKEARRKVDAPPRMVFSFGLLVRMPFTPLRYDPPVLSEATWRPLAGKAKSICETNGFEFRSFSSVAGICGNAGSWLEPPLSCRPPGGRVGHGVRLLGRSPSGRAPRGGGMDQRARRTAPG